MKTLFRSLLVGLTLTLCAATAYAQNTVTDEELGVSTTLPDTWTQVEGNERAVFNFKHEESHSQIEVIRTELMTADVADVFFETFHETLTGSDFTVSGTEDKTYGEYAGTETIYEFTHSGVTLKVAVFQFVQETTAWLVVSYIQGDVFDSFSPAYQSVVRTSRSTSNHRLHGI